MDDADRRHDSNDLYLKVRGRIFPDVVSDPAKRRPVRDAPKEARPDKSGALGPTKTSGRPPTPEAALAPLLKMLAEQDSQTHHQLIARGYGELARIADDLGPYQRARNERERDRYRPPLKIDQGELFEVWELLRRHGEQHKRLSACARAATLARRCPMSSRAY